MCIRDRYPGVLLQTGWQSRSTWQPLHRQSTAHERWFISQTAPHLNWPHFIWTECTVIGHSHSKPGRALWITASVFHSWLKTRHMFHKRIPHQTARNAFTTHKVNSDKICMVTCSRLLRLSVSLIKYLYHIIVYIPSTNVQNNWTVKLNKQPHPTEKHTFHVLKSSQKAKLSIRQIKIINEI